MLVFASTLRAARPLRRQLRLPVRTPRRRRRRVARSVAVRRGNHPGAPLLLGLLCSSLRLLSPLRRAPLAILTLPHRVGGALLPLFHLAALALPLHLRARGFALLGALLRRTTVPLLGAVLHGKCRTPAQQNRVCVNTKSVLFFPAVF